MNKDNRYQTELELMEAFTHQKSDAEIGMPDIEAELARVHAMAAKPRPAWGRFAAAVACVCAVAAIGIGEYYGEGDLCVAYVGGERITDETAVMKIMTADIREMNSANDIVEHQLSNIFNE